MKYEYSVYIVWSKEDEAYLARVPELPGCIADGRTQEEALKAVAEMAKEWIEVANEEKRDIPPPMSSEDCARMNAEFRKSVHRYIRQEVATAVERIFEHLRDKESESLFAGRIGPRFIPAKITVPGSDD
jgi:predicted RNase H-like HicB family nuclease